MPEEGQPADGPSVAKTLDDVLETGVGESKTWGYLGAYVNETGIDIWMEGTTEFSRGLTVEEWQQCREEITKKVPSEKQFVEDPYAGDPQKVLEAIRGSVKIWAQALSPPATLIRLGLGYKVDISEPGAAPKEF